MIKENKLLIVCGPTATGKTSLSIKLAQKFNAELISADSRQVYKYMDIGTGKDIPENSKFQIPNTKLGLENIGYYEIDGVKLWGYDLVEPYDEFSVSHFLTISRKIIKDIYSRGKIPIVVGGTGLYIDALINGIETANVPKNIRLRKELETFTLTEMQESLASLDPFKFAGLNISDRNNPRRLVRAIEVARYKLDNQVESQKNSSEFNVLYVGLTATRNILETKIRNRVEDRLSKGMENEIKKLLKMGVNWENQAMDTLGYGIWNDYFVDKDLNKLKSLWIQSECRYAKRQIVWFKRNLKINWFNIENSDYYKSVEITVSRWYSKSELKK